MCDCCDEGGIERREENARALEKHEAEDATGLATLRIIDAMMCV